MSQIQIRDAAGTPLRRINIRLSIGNQSSDAAYDDRFTDDAGNTAWPNPFPSTNGYTLYVNDRNVDARYGTATVLVGSLDGDIPIMLPYARIVLSRLVRIDGPRHRMVTEDGQAVFGRGASAFLLYKKFLDGVDITPVLHQLHDAGCNLVRLMGMFESLGGFNPKDYGDRYYDRIGPFCALCESYGLYVLWTACAATGGMMNPDEALEHAQLTAHELIQTNNALFSYVNEQGQHNNSVNREQFKAHVNTGWMLYDTGSFGSDIPCQPPFGTHAVLHCRRDYPANVKDGCTADHPNQVHDHLEVGMDEPARYGEDGSGDRHDDPRAAADAAGTAYTSLFWVFHSLQGERGDLLTGNTWDCAQAAFAAMKGH